MIGYKSEELQRTTFGLLQKFTDVPCNLIDNTNSDQPLTTLWNQVLEQTSADVHVLLNADVFVSPNWIRPIQKAFDADWSIAVAGPGANCGSQTVDLRMGGPQGLPSEEWLTEASKRVSLDYVGQVADREIFGFCYVVRRDIWRALRGFDERVPFYGNDTEYNLRCRRHGFKVVKVYDSYVHHLGGYSFAKKGDGCSIGS